MSIMISAVFDTVDAADLALAEVRRSGLPIEAFHIEPPHHFGENHPDYQTGDTPGAWTIAPFLANGSNDSGGAFLGNSFGGSNGALWGNTFFNSNDEHNFEDAKSRESILTLTVPDERVADAEGILVSAGGRKVRH